MVKYKNKRHLKDKIEKKMWTQKLILTIKILYIYIYIYIYIYSSGHE